MSFCGAFGANKIMENGLPGESAWTSSWRTVKRYDKTLFFLFKLPSFLFFDSEIGLGKLEPRPADDPFYGTAATKEELARYPPGTILRKRGVYLTDFPDFDAETLVGWQIAFTTRGPFDDPQNMVATIAIPPNAGKRDKMVLQSPKASGAQPSCRTSYFLRRGSGSLTGAASEQIFMTDYLKRGYITVLTDAQGQFDAFGSGPTAGRAVLDTIRAVLSFKELHLAPREEVRIVPWGYSAGGLATIWAAQYLEAYAPELKGNIVAWSIGGVPTDLKATAYSVKGGIVR